MTDSDVQTGSRAIMVDEVFPHAPGTIWATLVRPELMARWLKMTPTGFEPMVGNLFTFQTSPAGAWDGTIRCEVIEVVPHQRLAWRWRGGDAANQGYGSLLDTLVTVTLEPVDGGTRLSLVHSGFELPRNETAYRNMSGGWTGVVARIGALSGEQD
ncbi:SRPBCC domain-containing protein [Sphingomonas sp. MMS24-J13]|uniref:SRPBCC family protein n=1 Tax=Sphingomonas sp. MMS24-J13 TaxID=3238686 RepID=UPI00384B79B8